MTLEQKQHAEILSFGIVKSLEFLLFFLLASKILKIYLL